MSMSDPVADMLTRIRNASNAKKATVEVPSSKMKKELAIKLQEFGFIKKFVIIDDGKQGLIKILLNYKDGEPAIQGLERVSKPGLRIYHSANEIPKVRNGLGYALVTTSKGVKSDRECRKENIGGEVICKVW